MKKLLNKIISMIKESIKKRKLFANMICPECKSRLVYRDCAGWGIWIACIGCNKTW